MRLHGGYLKKEGDKRADRKDASGPLTTVSNSVRALIEEKIIKRQHQSGHSTSGDDCGAPGGVTESASQLPTPAAAAGGQLPMTQLVPALQEQGATPAAAGSAHSQHHPEDGLSVALPQDLQDLKIAAPDKLRRHSDSDHFVMKRPLSHYMTDKSQKRPHRAVSESGDPLPQLALADVLESSLLQGDYPATVDESAPAAAGDAAAAGAAAGYLSQGDVFAAGGVELDEAGCGGGGVIGDASPQQLLDAGYSAASGTAAAAGLQQFGEVSSYNRPLQSPTVNQSHQEAVVPPPPAPTPPAAAAQTMYAGYGGYSPLACPAHSAAPGAFQYPAHSHASPQQGSARHSPLLQSPLANPHSHAHSQQQSPLHKPESHPHKYSYMVSRSSVGSHMQSPLASPAFSSGGYAVATSVHLPHTDSGGGGGGGQISLLAGQYSSHQQPQPQSYQPPISDYDVDATFGSQGPPSGYSAYQPVTSQESFSTSSSYQPSYTLLMSSQADTKPALNGRAGDYYATDSGSSAYGGTGAATDWVPAERRGYPPDAGYNCEYRPHGFRPEDADDDVFTSPAVVGGRLPAGAVRKRRPAPLFIPAQAHSHQHLYQSSLRSPALFDHGAPAAAARPAPPYTAPPMLPPSRPGPGLYWSVLPAAGAPAAGQPRSAPAQPRHPGARRSSVSECPMEFFMELPPETDVIPHINVGPAYQAHVPDHVTAAPGHSAGLDVHRADLIWAPRTLEHINERELEMYLEFACCASAPAGGRNKEYALHLLHMTGGNIKDAMFRLMQPIPHVPADHPLVSLAGPENCRWTSREIQAFQSALAKHDKDFSRVSKEVLSKSTRECVQFYFLWKRVCVAEYRQLRCLRRQRQELHQSRLRAGLSAAPAEEAPPAAPPPPPPVHHAPPPPPPVHHAPPPAPIGAQPPYEQYYLPGDVKPMVSYPGDYPDPCVTPGFAGRGVLPAHARLQSSRALKTRSPTPDKRSSNTSAASPASSQGDAGEEFPCKLCGKVFYKVKSRNAHMKSHRPPDAESRRKGAAHAHARNTPPSPQGHPHSQRTAGHGRSKLAPVATADHHMAAELACLEPSMLSLPPQAYGIPNI